MLTLPSTTRVYLARDAADMRKSIDGLAIMVSQVLKLSIKESALFVFFNRTRDRVKVIYWDRTGFALWYKKLSKGRYRLPQIDKLAKTVSVSDLTCILEGLDLLDSRRTEVV